MPSSTQDLPALTEFIQSTRTWSQKLQSYKASGMKLVGYTGRFVPEELIRAAGAVPVLLCKGGAPEPPEATLPYILRFMSPFARAQIGYHLIGIDPIIPMLDLIIAQCDDCHMSRLADMLEYFQLPTTRVGVPSDWKNPRSGVYYQQELSKLKQKLETLTDQPITDASLEQSIHTSNLIRTHFAAILHLRKNSPPPISGYEFIQLNHASFSIDAGELISQLGSLEAHLVVRKSPFDSDSPRILVCGHVVAIGDYTIPKLLENLGAVIVADFLDEGIRHPQCLVESDGNLINNLANTYFHERTPPSIFQPAWQQRFETLAQMIQDFQIDGVIWYLLSFEEIYDMESSVAEKRFQEMGIPLLRVESSYEFSREAMGPLTTRLESFIEVLKAKKR